MRGPLLYCIEQIDNPDTALDDIELPDEASFRTDFRSDLLGGVVALTADATVSAPEDSWSATLYRPTEPAVKSVGGERMALTAIPYHAWANREPGPMRVWLRRGS
jgi:DUF1680 family protein